MIAPRQTDNRPTPLFSPSIRPIAEDELTIRDLARIVYSRRGLVAGSFALTFILVLIGTLMLPKTYVTQAKLLVRAEMQPVPSFFSGLVATTERRDYDPVARRLETEMELLETVPLLAHVVDSLKLTRGDVYQAPLDVLTRPLLRVWDGLRVSTGLLAEAPDRDGAAAALGGLARGLKIAPVIPKSPESGSNLISVTLTAPTPTGAHDQLAVLLDAYLTSHSRRASDEAAAALEIIDGQLTQAVAEMQRTDSRMRSFLSRGPGSRRASAATGSDMPSFTTARDDESVSRLKAQLLDLQMQLVQARIIYKDSSEKVLSLQGAIRGLESQVSREVANGAERASVLTLLTRDEQQQQQRVADLQRRRNEIALYQSVVGTMPQGVTVVDPPGTPSSWNWKKRLAIVIGGGVLGLMLGLALASLASYFDPTLQTAAAVRRAVGLPVVARIPQLSRESVLRATRANEHERTISGRDGDLQGIIQRLVPQLVSRVRSQANGAAGGRVIVVTSAESGAGKTTVASALAMQLAQLSYGRVLLVDTDLATPSLHSALQLTNGAGYSDALQTHDTTTTSALQAAAGVSLDVLTAGRANGASLAMNLDKVRAFVDATRERYDFVVFDAGTITDGSVITLQPVADAMLIVIDATKTRSMALRDAMTNVQAHPTLVAAAILNRVERDLPDFLYRRA